MIEPLWVPEGAVQDMHARQIATHSGLAGVRDANALAAALARPANLFAYGEPDMAALAAAYTFGIARNHAFSDGNKRAAWVVAPAFLDVNGLVCAPPQDEIIAFMLALAAGDLGEDAAAACFRARIG